MKVKPPPPHINAMYCRAEVRGAVTSNILIINFYNKLILYLTFDIL